MSLSLFYLGNKPSTVFVIFTVTLIYKLTLTNIGEYIIIKRMYHFSQ